MNDYVVHATTFQGWAYGVFRGPVLVAMAIDEPTAMVILAALKSDADDGQR